ncbi:MAG: diacylglycerol kinase family protein [Candidatus Gracilibacteria bacterium]
MHALVVFNPVSGAKKFRDVPRAIKETLHAHGYTFTWFETCAKKEQDFSSLHRQKFDKIIAVGGDGTVAQVVTFLMRRGITAPLIIIPCGSANLLATSLSILPISIKGLLEKSLNGKPTQLDLMCINKKHYGIIAVGRGYDAFVLQETTRPQKRKFGFVAYALTILKTIFFYRAKPYKITIDGARHYVSAKIVMAVNLLPIPHFVINPADGKADLFIVTARHRLKHFAGKKIVIKGKQEFKFQIDGDVFKSRVIAIEVIKKALTILS